MDKLNIEIVRNKNNRLCYKNSDIKVPQEFTKPCIWNGIIYGSGNKDNLCIYINNVKIPLKYRAREDIMQFRNDVELFLKNREESDKCVNNYEEFLEINKPIESKIVFKENYDDVKRLIGRQFFKITPIFEDDKDETNVHEVVNDHYKNIIIPESFKKLILQAMDANYKVYWNGILYSSKNNKHLFLDKEQFDLDNIQYEEILEYQKQIEKILEENKVKESKNVRLKQYALNK